MFQIIIKEIKEFVRDKMNFFFFLFFPVAMVFLLGNLLTSMDKAEEAIGEVKIQYVIDTKDLPTVMAIEGFFKAAEEHSTFAMEQVTDIEIAKDLIKQDKINAVVVLQGTPLEINIFEGTNHIKNRTVNAFMNSFTQTNKSVVAVFKSAPQTLLGNLSTEGEWVKQKDLGVNRNMIDYYAVAMLAMISYMSMMLGAGAFVGERSSKTINRLILAPKSRVSIFLQKILGMVPQVIIQIFLLMSICFFVYKANYARNWQDNMRLFLMFFVVTITMIAFGAVVGLLIKANPTAVLFPFLWIMMFFGGTFSKEMYMKGFTEMMPPYLIQQAAFDLAIFSRYEKYHQTMVIYIILLLFMLAIGALLFSRKEEER